MNFFYPYRHYLVSLMLFLAISIVSQFFKEPLGMINITLMHLLPIIVIALWGSIRATTIITVLSISILALFYIPPKYSLAVHDLLYLWSFIIFFVVGYTITIQARKIHENTIKELLFSTLSHDLKTPLSSILGNTSFLLDEPDLSPSTRNEVLQQLKDSSQQMSRLISNLLDSARLRHEHASLRKEWCDFEDLIGVALQEFRNEEHNNALTIDIDPELPLFYGDCALLARLLVNLLDNAFKYSGYDKEIRITIAAHPKSLRILFFNRCTPLKKADLENIFDKFYRLESSADIAGSGIGLAICKEIVQAHEGTINAYNAEEGICFEVNLPVLKSPYKR